MSAQALNLEAAWRRCPWQTWCLLVDIKNDHTGSGRGESGLPAAVASVHEDLDVGVSLVHRDDPILDGELGSLPFSLRPSSGFLLL